MNVYVFPGENEVQDSCKTCKWLASDLQEKGHFSCENLAPARTLQEACKSCKSRASLLQDLLALCARCTCKSCKNLAKLARKWCKNLASMDLQDLQIIFPWVVICRSCMLYLQVSCRFPTRIARKGYMYKSCLSLGIHLCNCVMVIQRKVKHTFMNLWSITQLLYKSQSSLAAIQLFLWGIYVIV